MCGINAIFRYDGKVEPSELRAMSSAIVHRGPNEAGFSVINNGRVGLASVRLSIIDIENGLQPIYNEDQSLTLVFNGEIYDYDKHRNELLEKGHRFRTDSDTEVIIHLYEEYGISLLEKINGEFAFTLWDDKKKELYAVRDRFGVKPLFYHSNNNEVLFSSEVKGILALDKLERKMSAEYITGTFMTLYSKSHSIIEGIRCIKPGHYAVINKDRSFREIKYWSPRFDIDESISFSQAKEGIRQLLTKSVRRRMIADVPVAVYLSGGIDSTLVCAIMAKHNQKLRAFNIGFTDPVYDESAIAKETAEFYGADFLNIKCGMEDLAEGFEKTLYHNEAVIVNPHSIAKQLLSAEVHRSAYKVCITGEGGDEYFAGYPYFRMEHIWRMLLGTGNEPDRGRQLLKEFCEKEAASEYAMWENSDTWDKYRDMLGYPSFIYNRAMGSYELMTQVLNKEALGISEEHNPENLLRKNYDFDYIKTLHPLNASRCISLNQLNSYMIPLLGDRVEMANSVEGRLPYLDRELVEFAGKLPPQYLLKTDQLREKYVLREAFESDLPPHIRKGKKHTFLSPNWDCFLQTKKGQELREDLLSNSAIRKTNIFDPKNSRKISLSREALDESNPLRRRLDIPMGIMLSLQMLHRLFIENKVSLNPDFEMVDRSPEA